MFKRNSIEKIKKMLSYKDNIYSIQKLSFLVPGNTLLCKKLVIFNPLQIIKKSYAKTLNYKDFEKVVMKKKNKYLI